MPSIRRAGIMLIIISLLTACGGQPAAQAPTAAPASTAAPVPTSAPTAATAAEPTASAPTAAPAAAAAFPVTIENKYGSTTIPAAPQRVISVGFNDQDAILALGVVPVGIRDWYGDQPNAVWPWAQDKLGGAKPAVLPANALNFEQIALLKPDLIIGISSGMTAEDYVTLSKIAPTLPQSATFVDYGEPWQDQTRAIGTALGRSQQAEQLIAAAEALFTEARAKNPAFNGASAASAVNFNGEYSAFGPNDVRGRLLPALGFTIPAEITKLAGDSFYTAISKERLDLLDTDVLIISVSTPAEREVVEKDPLFQQLKVAREKRVVFLDQQLSGAAAFSSVLSLPYLLKSFVPMLAAAIDGDPNTSSDAPAASAAPASAAVTFPLTLTDAAGVAHTFEQAPRIGCTWYGCIEMFADMGIPLYAVAIDQAETSSAFYSPAGPPEHLITDESNPEQWAAADIDVLLTRVPPSPEDAAFKDTAPIFFLHHPSYGKSSQTGYAAYIENLKLVGQLTGKPELAAAAITRFDTALANLKKLATPETQKMTVAVLFQDDSYLVVAPNNPFCAALVAVGLGTCVGEGEAAGEINAEQFLTLNPTWIVYQAGDKSYKDRTDPIWPQLAAVKEGHVYDAKGNRYYCCSTRGLIHALQEYVHYVLPAANMPDPGIVDQFDPTKSPLVKPE